MGVAYCHTPDAREAVVCSIRVGQWRSAAVIRNPCVISIANQRRVWPVGPVPLPRAMGRVGRGRLRDQELWRSVRPGRSLSHETSGPPAGGRIGRARGPRAAADHSACRLCRTLIARAAAKLPGLATVASAAAAAAAAVAE